MWEQIVDVTVPLVMKIVDVIKPIPLVLVSERVVELIVDVTVPLVMKELAAVAYVCRDGNIIWTSKT